MLEFFNSSPSLYKIIQNVKKGIGWNYDFKATYVILIILYVILIAGLGFCFVRYIMYVVTRISDEHQKAKELKKNKGRMPPLTDSMQKEKKEIYNEILNLCRTLETDIEYAKSIGADCTKETERRNALRNLLELNCDTQWELYFLTFAFNKGELRTEKALETKKRFIQRKIKQGFENFLDEECDYDENQEVAPWASLCLGIALAPITVILLTHSHHIGFGYGFWFLTLIIAGVQAAAGFGIGYLEVLKAEIELRRIEREAGREYETDKDVIVEGILYAGFIAVIIHAIINAIKKKK